MAWSRKSKPPEEQPKPAAPAPPAPAFDPMQGVGELPPGMSIKVVAPLGEDAAKVPTGVPFLGKEPEAYFSSKVKVLQPDGSIRKALLLARNGAACTVRYRDVDGTTATVAASALVE